MSTLTESPAPTLTPAQRQELLARRAQQIEDEAWAVWETSLRRYAKSPEHLTIMLLQTIRDLAEGRSAGVHPEVSKLASMTDRELTAAVRRGLQHERERHRQRTALVEGISVGSGSIRTRLDDADELRSPLAFAFNTEGE